MSIVIAPQVRAEETKAVPPHTGALPASKPSTAAVQAPANAQASVQNPAAVQPQAHTPAAQPAPPPATPRAVEASSHHWQAFIWDALPESWLRDPKRANLLAMYEHVGWKPLFVNSRFEAVPETTALMARIGSAEAENIDVRPYKLGDVKERLEALNKARAALSKAWPEYQDALADLDETGGAEAHPEGSHAQGQNATGATASRPAGQAQVAPGVQPLVKECFKTASAFDVRMSDILMQFASELDASSARDNPEKLTGSVSLAAFLAGMEPKSPHYKPLVSAYARYKDLATAGRQQRIPYGPTVRPGANGQVVSDLQKRLQQEGFYAGKVTGHFDAPTVEALKQYQTSHFLAPDGALGKQTQESLNVTFQAKAELIGETLRLLRKGVSPSYKHYIRVNIPQFMLEYYREGQICSVHRVIVGRATGKKIKAQGRWMGENQTPTLSSAIEQVVINPRWYVSDRIRLELDSEASKDPQYFAKHGYVPLSSNYPWGQPRIFQRPGPGNPLGKVKFEFPNAYAVYLHDTPKKSLFQRSRRDFSHGCVRVERATELALELLKDDNNPAVDKVPGYLENDREAYLKLSNPVPIIMEYLPVTTDKNGKVLFPGDPYGWYSKECEKKG